MDADDPSTDQRRALRTLQLIQDLAILLYPFPEHTQVQPCITFALGQIAGIASKAIRDTGTLRDCPPAGSPNPSGA